MAVRIRLRRMGRKKQPHYRVVVADNDSPRDGRFVESLGYYRPLSQPARLVLDLERVDHWLASGAQPSNTVKNLIDRARKGGDEKVAVGREDVQARQREEKEERAARRAREDKVVVSRLDDSGPLEEETPQDRAEEPEGSSQQDASTAEVQAEGKEESIDDAEDEAPQKPVEDSIARGEASAKQGTPPEARQASGSDATARDAEAASAGSEEVGTAEVDVPPADRLGAQAEAGEAERVETGGESETESIAEQVEAEGEGEGEEEQGGEEEEK